MAWETHTETTVDAGAGTVWTVVTDFETYEDWNPTLIRARGAPEIGERLSLRLSLPNGRTVPYRPRVTVVTAERELRWTVRFGGMLAAEHGIWIESLDDRRVRLVQREHVEGPLAIPVMGRLGDSVRRSIEAMNDALADRAEELRGT
jgi:hypothetical protein